MVINLEQKKIHFDLRFLFNLQQIHVVTFVDHIGSAFLSAFLLEFQSSKNSFYLKLKSDCPWFLSFKHHKNNLLQQRISCKMNKITLNRARLSFFV